MVEFRRLLAEAIAWCDGRVRNDQVEELKNARGMMWNEMEARADRIRMGAPLKSVHLRPGCFSPDHVSGGCRPLPRIVWPDEPVERVRVVQELAETRSELLQKEGRRPVQPACSLQGGGLLLYEPDGNLFDGMAELETAGFFDVDNVPPWDTWICYVDETDPGQQGWRPYGSFLVSWVPPLLTELVDQGIEVNPEQCILWAGDVDSHFTRELYAAGFLDSNPSRLSGCREATAAESNGAAPLTDPRAQP